MTQEIDMKRIEKGKKSSLWYKNPVKCIETGEIFYSILEAAKWHGCTPDLIYQTTHPSVGGCWGYNHDTPKKFVLI